MSILYKNGDGNIVSLIPDMNNIDDTTVSASTTYSSSKIEQINAEYPIASTTTGINPSITDSAAGLIQDITVYGRSDVSKNLFGFGVNAVDKTEEYRENPSQRLIVVSSDTNNIEFRYNGGTWAAAYIELPIDGTKTYAVSYDVNATQYSPNIAVDTAHSDANRLMLIVNGGNGGTSAPTTLSFTISNIQLELGSTPTPYEPYFSGIRGIGEDGEVDVVTCGKNLLNNPQNNSVIAHIVPGTYTLSFDYTTTGAGTYGINLVNSTAQEYISQTTNTNVITFNANSACDVTLNAWFVNGAGSFTGNTSNWQLELGSTSTAYEPYVSTTATVTTGIPLYAVGDVKDELDEKKGVVVKRIGVIDLGDLAWAYNAQNQVFLAYLNSTYTRTSTGTDGICIEYPVDIEHTVTNLPDKHSIIGSSFVASNVGSIVIKDLDYTDKNTFKAAVTGVKLLYILENPYEISLTSAELSALRNLRTYNPVTNVTITDAPTVGIGYLLNTDNGQAVAELENRIKSEIDEVKNENERSHFCYSYKIDMSDSNPATCVKPHFDPRYGCDNFNFTSAHMDYTNDKFDYGSWEGFIRRIARPCMLKYDGTVDYYLDPDDYSKKITGEASDVADVNYQGNAMVELEKLYFKRYTYNGIQYCFIADRKLDKSFKAYAHHDKYGRELDYIYRACYDGMYDGTRLRSISGVDYHNLNALTAGYIMSNTTRQEEINFAKANNVSTERGEGWNILHKAEWDYINDILILIGMSTNTQGTFGRGRDSGYVSTFDTGIISTGTMDTKGLFWGENNGSAGVKVLGIENPWANIWKSCAGWMLISNQHYTKMTFGTEDGSTGTGFNTDGTGYLATGASISANGYISDWAENDNGFLPTAASGSASTYRCDYVWQNTATYFALVGGYSDDGLLCGAFCTSLDSGAGRRAWDFGAALSYKPLAGGELAA